MYSLSQGITKEYLSKLDTMKISIKDVVDNLYSGNRKSAQKGMSLEFSDFKEYALGDDIRRIDWNSYARSQKLYVKRFNEERQAAVNLFIDISKSMDYGINEKNKGYYSKLVCAGLAYVALRNSDNVNIFAFAEKVKSHKVNIKNKASFSDIVDFLDRLQYEGQTNISKSISEATTVGLSRGISFILTDCYCVDGLAEAIKSLRYKKQSIVLFHICTSDEINPSMEGNIQLIDSETGEISQISVDESIIKAYGEAFITFSNDIKETCYHAEGMYKILNTDISILQNIFLSR